MLRRVCVLGVFLFVSAAAGEEAVVFIVNRSNPIQSISQQELTAIYSGQTTRWPDGQKIVAVNQLVTALARASVFRMLFNAGPGKEFSMSGSPAPFKSMTRSSGRSVKRLVSQLPNAIGYARVSAVDDSVKTLTVDGLGPGDAGYFLIVRGDGSSE